MATGYNDIEQSDKIYQAMIQQREALDKKRIENFLETHERALRESGKTEKEIYDELRIYRDKMEREAVRNRQADEIKIRKASLQALDRYETTLLESSNRRTRAQIHSSRIEREKSFQKEYEDRQKNELLLQSEVQTLQRAIISEADEAVKERLKDQLKATEELHDKEKQWISENNDLYGKSGENIINESLAKAQEIIASGDASREEIAAEKAAIENILKDLDEGDPKRAEAEKTRSDLAMKELSAQAEDRKQAIKDRNQQKKDEMKWLLKTEEGRTQLLKNATVAMVNGLSKMFDNLEQPINSFFEYQARYEARLAGSGNEYEKMMKNINKQIGISPFIKQTDMVKNLQTLIDKGIGYNVELRAYLATVTDNIASTFDAFDSNLLRLIRIQQNDSTAARLGIENALNEFLKDTFSDTSYLGEGGSGVSDQVTAALLDASAQLTHQGAAEMEFVAQKWLGSLYALGVSGEAVQNIAQGLGYLGSGNIENLTGNETLMSLLAMSATRGGTSISEILTGGLTAETTNKLLEGMVGYLSEIATNTDNNVTKSSIAQVFGLTNTDLRSITNLSQNDINNISKTDLNYAGALIRTQEQLTEIAHRTHLSQIISNVIDNSKTGAALTIGSNPALYGMYKALGIVSSLVGDRGMEIPGLTALGTGTASGIDVLSVAKAAIAGGSLLSSLINSLGNIGTGGLPTIGAWGDYTEAIRRGSGLNLQPRGVQSGFSTNAIYNTKGSGSISDMNAAAMKSANESAIENQSESDIETATNADKFYTQGLEELIAIRENIQDLTAENNALKVIVSSPSGEIDNKVKLSDITDDAVAKLSSALKPVILASLLGDQVTAYDSTNLFNPQASMIDIIRSALDGLNVHIDNDYFDDSILKSISGGI